MRVRERLALIAILVLAFVFVFAVVHLILRRSETAYNYPAYSSLNNSSNGTKAYFEALRRLGFLPVRNFQPIHKLIGAEADIFYAGPNFAAFRYSDAKELEQFERLAREGARVLIAFDPEGTVDMRPERTKRTRRREDDVRVREDLLKKRWGIELGYTKRAVSKTLETFLTGLEVIPVNWHFSSWAGEWKASETRGPGPLFLERRFDKGSIVLIANAALFTNRELLLHPDARVLAGIPGPHRQIIFDESHLGLEDTGTVIGLATAHGLDWMLLGFLVLGVLYVWRNAMSFVPPVPMQRDTAISGRDAHSALATLLMQSVPRKSILRTVAEEWNRTASHKRGFARTINTEKLAQLAQIDPSQAAQEYNTIAKYVNKLAG